MTKVAEDEDGRGGTVQFLTFNEEEYNEVWIVWSAGDKVPDFSDPTAISEIRT